MRRRRLGHRRGGVRKREVIDTSLIEEQRRRGRPCEEIAIGELVEEVWIRGRVEYGLLEIEVLVLLLLRWWLW